MTNAEIRAAIKADPEIQTLVNAGQDFDAAGAINAKQTAPVPLTIAGLMQAAPTTLAAIAGNPAKPSELEPIAARVRAGDATGVQSWADALLMATTMSSQEHATVTSLVTAALVPAPSVTPHDVSDAVASLRHDADGVARIKSIDWSAV